MWAALYLALREAICLGEIMRHLTTANLAVLADYWVSELDVDLGSVLDCRDPAHMGLAADEVCEDLDYRVPQAIAAAAIARGAEGLLVPSATRLGDNLIVFPDHLQPT
jgi:hypothetical protein